MKVIHYHFGKDGGAERFFVNLVKGLSARDVEQTCVIRPGRIWRKDIDHVAQIVESNFNYLSLERWLLPIKVRRMANRERPNVLFSWMTRASRLMPDYKGSLRISRLGGYPKHLGFFKNTDVIVCNTPGLADHVRNMGWDRGLEVISNFTNTERIPPVSRALYDTPEEAKLVISMGRFVHRKGFHTLLKAIAQTQDVYLWLAGDGEENLNLRKLATDLGIAHRTRFLGWQADVRPFLAAADIFAMPSSHEPLGNVILEAWAQGLPVVSTRSEGPQWFMRDGQNGLLVDIGNADGFADALNQIANANGLANALANGGKHTLFTQFSQDAVTQAYLELFQRKQTG